MVRQNDVAVFNKSDMYYNVMYNHIIANIIDAQVKSNTIQTYQMIRSLFIYTHSFFKSGKKEHDDVKKIATALDKLKSKVIIKTVVNTKEQEYQVQNDKLKIMGDLDNILADIYQLMHKHQLFIFTQSPDHRPSVVKD